jgi:Raf kinase inhibitor-like YbhB/YbcL family protein
MRRKRILVVLAFVLTFFEGCKDKTDVDPGAGTMNFELTSSVFREGETIPKLYTEDGKDISPPLKWSDVPEQTKSLVLICDDPDAPAGTWVHWVLFNLPADLRELSENVPKKETLDNGAKHGTTNFGEVGYGGPAPPPGKAHRYFFKLYALDTTLNLTSAAHKTDVEAAMKGHILAEGKLMGKYGR